MHVCIYVCIWTNKCKYNLLCPFLLFVCIWFQSWPLCSVQQMGCFSPGQGHSPPSCHYILVHSSLSEDGTLWKFPRFMLTCPLLPFSGLVFSRTALSQQTSWLWQYFCPFFCNVPLAIDAGTVMVYPLSQTSPDNVLSIISTCGLLWVSICYKERLLCEE